ncbi:hypothetical protein [Deinococcus aerophilus]|uniref:DUF3618 domain-containing protein n=1 Tax=Deinococcus aerophilus TaxID=522488 RepID=A0ABQ2GV79_9DEIO|nr:hypothetical protein [Deinococcus aerophilus]GGM15120.1 hypothetical protein GCM10010841_24520 [Deinococcus aerophilus]
MADYDYMNPRTEREEARERLKESIDALADRANLQLQMQKEPAKLLGGASAVGAVIGLVIGRQFRRSKKIYVDAESPVKHQQALIKAQKSDKGGVGGVGGALVATLGTLAVKTLTDRVLAPKLEELANSLLEKAGESPKTTPGKAASGRPERSALPSKPAAQTPRPMGTASTSSAATASFLKSAPDGAARPSPNVAESYAQQAPAAGSTPPQAVNPEHPGVVPTPKSVVEAKAQGSVIAPEEKSNPNRH